MLFYYIVILLCRFLSVASYSNSLYTLTNVSKNYFGLQCGYEEQGFKPRKLKVSYKNPRFRLPPGSVNKIIHNLVKGAYRRTTTRRTTLTTVQTDPFVDFQKNLHQFLFGPRVDSGEQRDSGGDKELLNLNERQDNLIHFPAGNTMRAEMFHNKSGVHFPIPEYMHVGFCKLNVTSDLMQTAVNAFSIFLEGTLEDVLRLPAEYVLNSARTIAMLKVAQEKLAATWTVIKGDRKTEEIPFWTLEKYRPLFQYINGREIARLNLSDNRILSYIGTHSALDRHQMGVVASRYMQINPQWSEPKYLNLMNNLLCGVPMGYMRRISSNTYLQLTHQVFYHIRACDPLQRRFYLAMMTKTETLGKSYSWNARDVSRLGLLLAEVEGPDLGAINPEAMSGISAQVMLEIPAHNLQHITEIQLKYIGLKPLNILARQLKAYQDSLYTSDLNSVTFVHISCYIVTLCLLILGIGR